MNREQGDQLYLRTQVRAATLGGGRALVLGKAGTPALVDQGLLDLAATCAGPDTLDGHAARMARDLGGAREAAPGGLARHLARLADLGVLVGWRDLVGGSPPLEPPRRLATLAVVTRDRPAGLARCLRSHLAHLAAFGRRIDRVLVMDGSRAPAAVEEARARAQALAREWGTPLVHLAAPERDALAGRLAAAAGVEPRLVRFAFGEVAGCSHDTGGNRNALLLATAGLPFLSSDDDVIGDPQRPLAGAAAGDDRLHLVSAGDPTTVTLFESAEAAAAAAARSPRCLFEAHEELLGRPLAALVAARGPAGVRLDDADPATLVLLGGGRARVALTSSALLGDSGAAFPSFYLWSPAIARQLAGADDARYARLIESRQILRAVPSVTVSDGTFVMATHLALANDLLLPPFLPVLRGQDLLFGRTLRLCAPGDLVAHLPAAVLHAPLEPRRATIDRLWPADATAVKTAAILDACLAVAGAGLASAAPGEARLRLLGRHLQEQGALAPDDLASLLRERLLADAAPRLAACSAMLADAAAPGPWLRDLERYLHHQMEHLARAQVLVPVDLLPAAAGTDQAPARLQALLRDWGRLMESWPALYQAARAVRFAETAAAMAAAALPGPRP